MVEIHSLTIMHRMMTTNIQRIMLSALRVVVLKRWAELGNEAQKTQQPRFLKREVRLSLSIN
jgi:hypothetical protein